MTLPFFRNEGSGKVPRPIAMAHRGFSPEGLENSMAAFHAAAGLGYRYLETDVRTTADGVVLAFHDEFLDRVTESAGQIGKLTAAEVATARIRGREPIPTFDDLVTGLPGIRLNVDVKDWKSVEAFAAAVERHQVHDRILVASFSDRRRRAVLALLTRPVASSAGVVSVALFTVLGRLLPDAITRPILRRVLRDVSALQVPARYGMVQVVTPGFIRRAHNLGLAVHVWTVNAVAEMQRLLALGVDGIVTDRADLLREVLLERGQWQEPGRGERQEPPAD